VLTKYGTGFTIALEVDKKFLVVELYSLMLVNLVKRLFTQSFSTQSNFRHYLHNSMSS